MLEKDAIEHLLVTGRGQQSIQKGDTGDAFFIDPRGVASSLVHFFAPTRVRQKVVLGDTESFCEYFKRFASEDSIIFGNVTDDSATFTAVLDYHKKFITGKASPDYCHHKATFTTKKTPEWEAWLKADRKAMSQIDFAVWLEDNLHLFTKGEGGPDGAELLELVKSLHGHQNANFGQSIRLDNGAHSVKYEEVVNVQGTVKGGEMVLPPFVYGGFSLFRGMGGYMVKARLKTRIESRKLVLFFETVALTKTVLDCLQRVVERIEEETERTILIGALE